jgi:hypothetical protein
VSDNVPYVPNVPNTPDVPVAPHVRRWQVHLGVVPMFSGVLFALGLLVFLQQAGSVYPTMLVTILFLVGGLAVGIILPTIAFRISRRD